MKITELSLQSSNEAVNSIIKESGLRIQGKDDKKENEKLIKLGSVVALIGKNGSGKSRFLKIISEILENSTIKQIENVIWLENESDKLNILSKNITLTSLDLNKVKQKTGVPKEQFKILRPIIGRVLSHLNDFDIIKKLYDFTEIVNEMENFEYNFSEAATSENVFIIQNSILDKLQKLYSDIMEIKYCKCNYIYINNETEISSEINIETIFEMFVSADNNFTLNSDIFITINNELEKLISKISNRYTALSIKKNPDKNDNRQITNIEKFVEKIKDFLKIDFIIDIITSDIKDDSDGISGIKGRWFDNTNKRFIEIKELSPGQKIMLTYITFLFLNEIKTGIPLREQIILIDEPENHLHPNIQVKLIELLRELIGSTGQLWIATHSPIIMAHLTPDEIFHIDDSTIYSPSKDIPNEVLNSLFETEENIEKFADLIINLYKWEFERFARQCFDNPDVILNVPDDPQREQILNTNLISKSSNPVILDFAAGKGRLTKVILEHFNENEQEVKYEAYEMLTKFHDDIKGNANDPNIQIYADLNKLKDIENKYDYILLCNALHEIPVKEWKYTIDIIVKIGNTGGSFIFMEDNILPKGELPNEIGFLCLNKSALAKLLGINERNYSAPQIYFSQFY